KLGVAQLLDEPGAVVPVAVSEAGPCPVVQVRTEERDGYRAIQIGWGAQKAKRTSRAERGHAAKAGLEYAPAVLREFRVEDPAAYEPGQTITVQQFAVCTRANVRGTTRGRGLQGVV